MNTALQLAQTRYTCKAYDAAQKIDEDTFNTLLEMLRLAPSSINIQPWQFLVVNSDDKKSLLTQSMTDGDAHNVPKVMNASHILVLCTKTSLDGAHLDKVLQAEQAAGRFATDEIMQSRKALCSYYIEQFAQDPQKLITWAENQTFIALGHLLLSAAMLGIDATPIGGYDAQVLDDLLDLPAQNLKSSVLVSLGYASSADGNKTLPKARLAMDDVVKFL
ncbi:oxygen-insensitive NAD(P)H nitroreductase [Moraxella sp. FZFQ2102]|uniref:oxygen-insensitive NAD(P)H nitroreductase n=1 Tax=Moraxella sp. FZFQ2102 TaxID=2953752 RepID=UPI00209BFC38|nr:oxygen-insensitive NAD(P)H nitroreductase [Moraxella sp. FZFQ2102]USZ14986.1 oxygen-insensitive NAD(P)H nitroreductase [Moraxella sp. FZFQ2102]